MGFAYETLRDYAKRGFSDDTIIPFFRSTVPLAERERIHYRNYQFIKCDSLFMQVRILDYEMNPAGNSVEVRLRDHLSDKCDGELSCIKQEVREPIEEFVAA
jgi:hypothetical protein